MRKPKMETRRLLRLAAFLREVPRNRYNQDMWGDLKPHDRDLEHPCDTAGCALGWATVIPSFRRAGFKFGRDAPKYKRYDGLDAGRVFFGLTELQAKSLFGSAWRTKTSTPKQVAKKIESLVKNPERYDEIAEEEDGNYRTWQERIETMTIRPLGG